MTQALEDLIKAAKRHDFRGRLITFDPGETTGITLLERTINDIGHFETTILAQWQVSGWPLNQACASFSQLLDLHKPNMCIYEAYHVYAWRLNEHKFSEVPTIQIIGCLKTLCIQRGIPTDKQTAQIGKGFFTDERLKKLNLYFPGQQHARDSLRHACQFVTFGIAPH